MAAELPPDIRRRVFVIVPAYNEASTIGETVRELVAEFPSVVVIDDDSEDQTAERARAHTPYVLRHAVNRGQGAALQTGIEFALAAGADYLVTFDADGQHRVDDIFVLLQPLLDGQCDITLGSRFLGSTQQMPWLRWLILRAAVLLTRVMSRIRLTDVHNGLRAFTRRAAGLIDIRMDRMAHASELIDFVRKSELPYREVPVQIRYTEYSLTRQRSLRHAIHILFHYLTGRVTR